MSGPSAERTDTDAGNSALLPDGTQWRSVHRLGGRGPRVPFDETAMFAAVERAYPLGHWRSWRSTQLGASNASWFVETDAGSFVLRRSHPLKTTAGARFECGLIDLLRAHGYPAPPVQRTRDGGPLIEVGGAIHMVMRRLPGDGYDGGSPRHRRAAARGLGRYHAIVSEFAGPPEGDRSFGLARLGPAGRRTLMAAVETVAPHLEPDAREAAREQGTYLAGAMQRLQATLDEGQHELTTLVVHASYAPTSLLLVDDRLSAVLDFDRAAHDLLGFDLAYALDAFCRQGPVRRAALGLDPRLVAEFLDHYREEVPLPDADIRALPALLRAQRLGKVLRKCDNVLTLQATAPEQPTNVTRFPRVLERECARVRWLEQNLTTLTENA